MTEIKLQLEEKKEWVSLKEASKLFKKSPHTLKKLIYTKKAESKTGKGKYGRESRLKLDDLLAYYNLKFEDLNHANKDGYTNGKSSKNTSLNHGINQDEIIKILKREIEDLKQDKKDLQEIIREKDKQLETEQRINEKAQILAVQQNQMLMENKKSGNWLFSLFGTKEQEKS